MNTPALKRKWRPALWMVVFGVIMLVAVLPLVGLLLIIWLEHIFQFSFQLRTTGGFLALATGCLVMGGLIGVVFLRALLNPIQALIARTAEIEAGNPDAYRPLEYGGTQEVATLSDRFFRLAQGLSERSNYLTLFSTHLSHELKTPLTSIQGAAELLRHNADGMADEQRDRFLKNIVDDTGRLTALSNRLRELARTDALDTGGQSNLKISVEIAVSDAGLTMESTGPIDQLVPLSNENAGIVWKQLTENAAQQGAATFSVKVRETGDGLEILVQDDGAAISPANADQLFDPFFTTRREEGGTGMGLGIAEALLRGHGGMIEASSAGDYKFRIRLPGLNTHSV